MIKRGILAILLIAVMFSVLSVVNAEILDVEIGNSYTPGDEINFKI